MARRVSRGTSGTSATPALPNPSPQLPRPTDLIEPFHEDPSNGAPRNRGTKDAFDLYSSHRWPPHCSCGPSGQAIGASIRARLRTGLTNASVLSDTGLAKYEPTWAGQTRSTNGILCRRLHPENGPAVGAVAAAAGVRIAHRCEGHSIPGELSDPRRASSIGRRAGPHSDGRASS